MGSVDIDMVRISYVFLSIHLCAQHESKFRFKRKNSEHQKKGWIFSLILDSIFMKDYRRVCVMDFIM
jgi:hypothetical protein